MDLKLHPQSGSFVDLSNFNNGVRPQAYDWVEPKLTGRLPHMRNMLRSKWNLKSWQ